MLCSPSLLRALTKTPAPPTPSKCMLVHCLKKSVHACKGGKTLNKRKQQLADVKKISPNKLVGDS